MCSPGAVFSAACCMAMKNPSVVMPGMKAMLSVPDFVAVPAVEPVLDELALGVLVHAVTASAAAAIPPSTAGRLFGFLVVFFFWGRVGGGGVVGRLESAGATGTRCSLLR